MALSRRFLKGMGLTEEQIDSVIDAHTETVDALKAQIDQYKADAEKLPDVQRQLDAGGNWEQKYTELKNQFDTYKADTESKELLTAKQSAYRALLKAQNIPDKYHDRILKMTDFNSLEMEGDAFKQADAVAEGIKTEWSDFIGTPEAHTPDVETPPASGKVTARSKDEILAIKDTAERQKAIAENHDLFGF